MIHLTYPTPGLSLAFCAHAQSAATSQQLGKSPRCCCPAPREHTVPHIASPGKDLDSKFEVCVSLLQPCKVEKIICQTTVSRGPSVFVETQKNYQHPPTPGSPFLLLSLSTESTGSDGPPFIPVSISALPFWAVQRSVGKAGAGARHLRFKPRPTRSRASGLALLASIFPFVEWGQ